MVTVLRSDWSKSFDFVMFTEFSWQHPYNRWETVNTQSKDKKASSQNQATTKPERNEMLAMSRSINPSKGARVIPPLLQGPIVWRYFTDLL